MMQVLQRKRVLVTGSGSGCGQALVVRGTRRVPPQQVALLDEEGHA